MFQKFILIGFSVLLGSCIQQKEREPEQLVVPEVPTAQKSATPVQTATTPTAKPLAQNAPIQKSGSPRFGEDDVDVSIIDRSKNPRTPSQKLLKSLNPIDNRSLNVEHMKSAEGRTQRVFLKDGKRFNGWTTDYNDQIDISTKFFKYVNGLVEWQIGFYNSGELNLDVRKTDGLNYGHQRFFNKQGFQYIDGFYSEPGKADGVQQSWFADGKIARDALYNKGEIVYDVMFDQTTGKVNEYHGTLPDKYKDQVSPQ